MPRVSTKARIKFLEAKIADIKLRAERERIRKNPAINFMKAALRSIENAMRSTDDVALRNSLGELRANASACLALTGVAAGWSDSVLDPSPRATSADKGKFPVPNRKHLLEYVKRNPGRRSEQISEAFSTNITTLRPQMLALIMHGKVRTEGMRRGKKYYARV